MRARANDSLSGDIPAGESLQIAADCATATTVSATSLTNHGTIP